MHNIEAERSLLSTMMLDPSVIDVVRRWIEEDNVFYDRFNKDIWRTISRLKIRTNP